MCHVSLYNYPETKISLIKQYVFFQIVFGISALLNSESWRETGHFSNFYKSQIKHLEQFEKRENVFFGEV